MKGILKAIGTLTLILSLFNCELGKVANTAPTGIAVDSLTIAENSETGTVIGTISATDAEGDKITYQLGGTDAASFSISEDKLVSAAVFDYETKAEYSIKIAAIDSNNASTEEEITVTIQNVLEDGEMNAAPTNLNISATSVLENTMLVGLVSAEDDITLPEDLVYTLGGTDSTSFTLYEDLLIFVEAPDYETKSSYEITLTVDDGSETATETFTITVEDFNENYMAYWSMDDFSEATDTYNLTDNADDPDTEEVEGTSGDFYTEDGISDGYITLKDDIGTYLKAGSVGSEEGKTADFALSGTDSFTISFWMKQSMDNVEDGAYPCILEYSDAGSSVTDKAGYRVILRPDGKVRFRVYSYDNETSATTDIRTTEVVADDQWHHIVVVYDAGEMAIYRDLQDVDGEADATATANLYMNAKSLSGDIFSIGGYSSTAKNNPGGISLDELYFYDSALSKADIVNLGK